MVWVVEVGVSGWLVMGLARNRGGEKVDEIESMKMRGWHAMQEQLVVVV
jgi:hypothetical protein